MKLLVVQHDHVSPLGPVAARFAEHGYEIVHHSVVPASRFDSPGVIGRFPSFAEFDAVVAMGAPWSTYDSVVGSWVTPELEELRKADEAGVPVLGICFGGQLLATAHGGAVARSPLPEIGWTTLETDALIPAGPWFEWHYDRWTLPPGAVEVARSPSASQAFVLRRNLALQFHPELTPAMLQGWLAQGAGTDARARGHDPEALLAQTRQESDVAAKRAHALVDAFLTHVAT
ncbi:type 1 glutamine amidotransferase [Paractinoplanes lichenicola]|nr:type 1 glutamine amidotransferase [Actinoplanes lichenicola]